MEFEVDWDLHAVVRGCCTNNLKQQQSQRQQPHVEKVDQNCDDGAKKLDELFGNESRLKLDSFTTASSAVTSSPPPPPRPELFDQLFSPFLISPLLTTATSGPFGSKNQHLEPSISSSNLIQARNTTATARSKRRKNQFKKICEVPPSGLTTDDKWSWRKYGQKPIKGSPYPRGYYRCSSSKGCPARKQVERSRTDPNKFILTYTSEHNHPAPTHRNSLAGISRQQNSNKLSMLQSSKPGTSSSSVPTSPSDDDDEMQQSVKTEVQQYELDEILCNELEKEKEKEVLLDDDFFDGLDEMRLPIGQGLDSI